MKRLIILLMYALWLMAFRTAAATPSGNYDVNHDGEANIADVTLLVDYLLGAENGICLECANVNGDEAVDIADVTTLIDMLLAPAE